MVASDVSADVESLAIRFRISVVALDEAVAYEARLWGRGKDGIILSWAAWNCLCKSCNRVFIFLACDNRGGGGKKTQNWNRKLDYYRRCFYIMT